MAEILILKEFPPFFFFLPICAKTNSPPQYDGVPHEREINGYDQDVEFGKPAVGYAFDEGGSQQDDDDIKGDFANFFGKVALGNQPVFECQHFLHRRAWRFFAVKQFELYQPFGKLLGSPVEDAARKGDDAEPFVQAIHFVQSAERGFQYFGAHGEHQAGTHRQYADGASELQQ